MVVEVMETGRKMMATTHMEVPASMTCLGRPERARECQECESGYARSYKLPGHLLPPLFALAGVNSRQRPVCEWPLKGWSRQLAFGFKCPATILRDDSRGRLAWRNNCHATKAIAPGLLSLGGRELVADQLQRGVGVDATGTEVVIATDRSEIIGTDTD